jgi:hypothetical protein
VRTLGRPNIAKLLLITSKNKKMPFETVLISTQEMKHPNKTIVNPYLQKISPNQKTEAEKTLTKKIA